MEFNPGVVQYGYTDGYWTRTHEWHTWDRPEHVEVYRKTPNAAYYEYRHDRGDPDMGWRRPLTTDKSERTVAGGPRGSPAISIRL